MILRLLCTAPAAPSPLNRSRQPFIRHQLPHFEGFKMRPKSFKLPIRNAALKARLAPPLKTFNLRVEFFRGARVHDWRCFSFTQGGGESLNSNTSGFEQAARSLKAGGGSLFAAFQNKDRWRFARMSHFRDIWRNFAPFKLDSGANSPLPTHGLPFAPPPTPLTPQPFIHLR